MKSKGNFGGCFIKVGQLQYMKDLLKNGLMYCNTVQYFANCKDEKYRGDHLENVIEINYIPEGKIELTPKEKNNQKNLNLEVIDFKLYRKDVGNYGNLYCIYAINLLNSTLGIPHKLCEDMKRFGDTAILIHNTHEFMERLKVELFSKGFSVQAGLVEYKDFSKFTGAKTIMQKDIIYEYQHEWRLHLKSKENLPINIELDSIEDIAVLIPVDELANATFQSSMIENEVITICSNLNWEKYKQH